MSDNRGLKIFFAVVIAAVIAALSFVGGFFTHKLTRSEQVSSFEWVLKTIRDNYFEDIPDDVLFDGSLKGLVESCLDSYSAYYTAEEYKSVLNTRSGKMSGLGISYMYVAPKKNDGGAAHPTGLGGAVIETVIGNSPAFISGLRAGEIVTQLRDNKGTVEVTSSAVFTQFLDGKKEGEQFAMITDRGERVMAKASYDARYCTMITSQAELSVYYENGKPEVEKTGEGYAFLPEDCAYLRLSQFYGDAATEMAALMEKFNAENRTSLILDLRGNGGGYVDKMCDISGIFTGQLQDANKFAMHAVYKNGTRLSYSVSGSYRQDQQLKKGVKVSVLADNGTASASEALIGVLIDNGVITCSDIYLSDFSQDYLTLTKTVGKNCQTYGKGIMQTTFVNQATGEALKLTTAKIYWPNGECIHGTGLTEQMGCKTVKTDWDVMYGDPQLQSVINMLYGR